MHSPKKVLGEMLLRTPGYFMLHFCESIVLDSTKDTRGPISSPERKHSLEFQTMCDLFRSELA